MLTNTTLTLLATWAMVRDGDGVERTERREAMVQDTSKTTTTTT